MSASVTGVTIPATSALGRWICALALAALLAACADDVPAPPKPNTPVRAPEVTGQAPATRRAQEDGAGAAAAPTTRTPPPPPASVSGGPAARIDTPPARGVFAEDVQAIGQKVVRSWSQPVLNGPALDAVIQVRVAVDEDGTVLAVRTVDEARMRVDSVFRQWAESLEDAIVRASPLPIPPDRFEQFKLMILPFNPRLVFSAQSAAAAEINKVQEHVAEFWFPPRLPPGAKGQDFAVSVRINVDPDGTVREARALDQTRVLQDPLYRLLADSAERAIRQASPLPLGADGGNRPRVLLLNFVADDE